MKRAILIIGAVIFAIVLFGGVRAFLNRPPVTPVLPNPPLKNLAAARAIDMGNFAITSRLNEKPYVDILTGQFDFVLADNTPNWYFTDGGLRPTRLTYNFKNLDSVFAFADAHHMPVQAHHYVWGEEKWLPDWLKRGRYDKQQLLDIIHEHIITVGKRYEGSVREWTVVNEAFSRQAHAFGLHDWWADHIGDLSYIDQSFIWAREADPNSKLILNDFNNESKNDISDAMYSYIKSAKARKIPIDGIGMQMHIDGSHPPPMDEVISNMQRFGKLGVQVYITEFDVNMNEVKADPKDKDQIEGAIYYEMMRACIESKVCHSFAILGITDRETWYNYMGLTDPRPLPFDKNYKPKQAFFSLRDALMQE